VEKLVITIVDKAIYCSTVYNAACTEYICMQRIFTLLVVVTSFFSAIMRKCRNIAEVHVILSNL